MKHEFFMERCFDLALLGAGRVSPNPMVGAVLVFNGKIIGEGWHKQYGKAHAEVNALASVKKEDRDLIKKSTLYVSLEPCCIHGKTPPCTELILQQQIKKVVVSCIDHTSGVKGAGLVLLEKAGVEVMSGILPEKGKSISAFRNTFAAENRPYIQLKFAQTRNGFMGQVGKQVWISNLYSKILAHKYRSIYDAILIGTHTAIIDNPQLNNRLWTGRSPLRIVLDKDLKIPKDHFLFSDGGKTWVLNESLEKEMHNNCQFHRMKFDENLLENLLKKMTAQKITSLIVEGGAFTLGRFLEKNYWDEAMVFTCHKTFETGIKAPQIPGAVVAEWPLADDLLTFYRKPRSNR